MTETITGLFDPKDPGEIIPLTFDFEHLTATPSNPAIAVTRHSGSADANPATILLGSPQVIGTSVVQKITGGVDGTTYKLVCEAVAPDGCKYRIPGKLPVVAL